MIINDPSASALEKGSFLATILAGIFGIWRTLLGFTRWLSGLNEERSALRKLIIETEPLIPRFHSLEQAVEAAARERGEIVKELRGLRRDIHEVLMLIAGRDEK